MIAAFALALTAASPDPCTPASLAQQVQTAIAQIGKSDLAGAKATIAPTLACSVDSSDAYLARVLGADVAGRSGDWAAARTTLNGVTFHPEVTASARAAELMLHADKVLKDQRRFTEDRSVIVAGNNAMLSRIGRKVESFRIGGFSVTAFEATVAQRGLVRVLEFIAVPDDPAGYPEAIHLTDDVATGAIMHQAKQSNDDHAWFIDDYTCGRHTTVEIFPPGSPRPTYAAVKDRVVTFLDGRAQAASRTDFGGDQTCGTIGWILPGIGASLHPTGS